MNGITLPCNILVPNIDNLSYTQWLQVRSTGIGGSDVAAATSLSPWKSAHELWEEKALGKLQPRQESDSLIFGKLLEPIVISEFVRRTSLTVHPLRSMLQHPVHSWMLANLDGIVEDPARGLGVFEAKTTAFRDPSWNQGAPDHYLLQLQHYMAVSGLDYSVICVLIAGSQIQWTTVERDEELIAGIIELERRFWEHVKTKTPPPVDASNTCSDYLARRFPASANNTPLILLSEADEWVQEYLAASAEETAAAERKRLCENRLKEAIGEHKRATTPGGYPVSWKSVGSTRLDGKKLKADLPDVFAKYTTESSSRRFSIGSPGK